MSISVSVSAQFVNTKKALDNSVSVTRFLDEVFALEDVPVAGASVFNEVSTLTDDICDEVTVLGKSSKLGGNFDSGLLLVMMDAPVL